MQLSNDPPNANPSAAVMAGEAMPRTLAAQISAIWPQEQVLIERYRLPPVPRILDAGCGTGEATEKLATLFPSAQIVGVDVLESLLAIARSRFVGSQRDVVFRQDSIFKLNSPSQHFDLTVCRHVLQSIPHTDRVIAELVRVTKRGGYIHLLAEDLDMIHFDRQGQEGQALNRFWQRAPEQMGASLGTNVFGRHIVSCLSAQGLDEISLEYAVVDTVRVSRDLLAAVFRGWRDSLGAEVTAHGSIAPQTMGALFENMIAQVLDPGRYVVWLIPIISARV